MKQAVFEARYGERWREFEDYLDLNLTAAAKRKKKKAAVAKVAETPLNTAISSGQAGNPYSAPKSVTAKSAAAAKAETVTTRFAPKEFAARYRELAQHVALARDRHYSGDLIARLEVLVLAGHQTLYRDHDDESSNWWQFLAYGLPMLVRARWRTVTASAMLFYLPCIAAGLAVYFFPEFVYQIMDASAVSQMHSMYSPDVQRVGRPGGATADLQMFSYYIMNNVSINFKCFASGLLFGVGTIFVLLFNGLHIVAASGYLTGAGLGITFWSFVAGHSALELTGIVLSGAAGLEMGHALVAPGGYTRIDALRRAMRPAVGLILGAALLTALAAIVEGFWSANTLATAQFKYMVGGLFWVAVISYLGFARSPSQRVAASASPAVGARAVETANG